MEMEQNCVSQECYWKIFTWYCNVFKQQLPNGNAAGIGMKEPLQESLLKYHGYERVVMQMSVPFCSY